MKRILLIVFVVSALASLNIHAQTSHTCTTCQGSGKSVERCPNNCHNGAIFCTTCDYRGSIRKSCSSCNGRGSISSTVNKRCLSCGGSRYTKMSKQTPCTCRGGKRPQTTRGGNTIYVDCSRCNGTGYLTSYYNAACRTCGGTGYSGTETTSRSCTSCGGVGSISSTCSKCGGKGCYTCSTCKGYANITATCSRCKGYGVIYTN